jgi:hypothetical protein
MKRLLLDTNIYGEMVVDSELDVIKVSLLNHPSLIVFGSKIIRTELRATPKKIKIMGSNLRIDLLSLYDDVVKERVLDITPAMEALASDYYLLYKEVGGGDGKKEMYNDFLLVASASLKEMDIVISNDESTLKSNCALKAYYLVNTLKKIRVPQFINYKEFKALLG